MKRSTENLRHTRWECKYHVVFIPKYRKKSIYGHGRGGMKRKSESKSGNKRKKISGSVNRTCSSSSNKCQRKLARPL